MPPLLYVSSPSWRRFASIVLLSHLFGIGAPMAAANPAHDAIVERLRAGNGAAALQQAEAALQKRPQDPQLLLLRADALATSGDTDAAIQALRALIRAYPTAPAPYNNLARLYARRGELEQARDVLERGLAGDPAYATLHRNLAGVYEAQAQIEYAQALELGNVRPKPELEPLLALRTPEPLPPAPNPTTQPAPHKTVVATKPRKPEPAPRPAQSQPQPQPPRTQPAAAPSEAQSPLVLPPESVAPNPRPASAAPDPQQALASWAKAWSAQDIDGYLAAYAADFRAPGGQRSKWAQKRRQRLRAPQWIRVRLDHIQVMRPADDLAVITAHQTYRSNTFKSTVRKRWRLILERGAWRILEERVLR